MKVNGKDDIPYIMEHKIHVWNHQPVMIYQFIDLWIIVHWPILSPILLKLDTADRDPEIISGSNYTSPRFTKSKFVPSGKRLHSYGKIHHAINGKIHYFYGHFQ